ncbi:MAG: adenylyltransferase/cytidyltransferase family protein [Bacteroidetes bacterium]|nr:adenylyltransferase/cytidyltransferase family protein [Bacteroidota bacterium]
MADPFASKIWTWEEVAAHARAIRESGKKIVFTNGVFDLLHAGHVTYLAEAAALGDFLIVGLNSDSSVQRLGKSPARPLQNEFSRSRVLAALTSTGAVVVFDQDTPAEIIRLTEPDVLVKGADYAIENIVGADFVLARGGSVQTIPFIDGYSTTAIEKKILLAHQPHP